MEDFMKREERGLRNMTVGSPAGHIFLFALPLLLGSFLQQLYNMVDSWVVGNYVGDAALAAVGVGYPVIFMFISLFMGIANGGTVVISQYYGAGKMDRVRDAVDTIYTTFIVSAVPVTVLALLLVKPLLFLLRVDQTAYHEAWVYMMIVCAGLVGTIGYNTNAGILNGIGNSRTTLLFLAVAAVLNIILDLVLVLNAGMGVAGVALGTIISQTFSWLFGLFYINRKYPQIAIHPFCFRFDRALFRQVLGIGLPAGLQMSLVSLGIMAVMSKVDTFGKAYTAAYTVGNKLDSMAFLTVQALTNSITAFVGQNTGAKKPERVRIGVRIAVTATVVWCLFMTAVLLTASNALFHLFSPEAAVAEAGGYYIRAIMPPYVLFGTMYILNGAMRGAGESIFPMATTVLSMIVMRVPAVYYLANRFGPERMFYGFGIGWIGGFILCTAYYFSGRWQRRGSLAEENS
mgnify:CR=1 FL=1